MPRQRDEPQHQTTELLQAKRLYGITVSQHSNQEFAANARALVPKQPAHLHTRVQTIMIIKR